MKKIISSLNKYKEVIMTSEEKKKVWNAIAIDTFLYAPNKDTTLLPSYRQLVPLLHIRQLPFIQKKYALGMLAGTLIISGSLSVFAQGSLPGDLLYPVKTKVNEKIQVVIALTPEEKARTEALLATKRLEEAEALALQGKLNPTLAEQTIKAFNNHVSGLETQLKVLEQKSELTTIAKIGILFQTRIAVHVAVLKDIEVNNAIISSSQKDILMKSTVDSVSVIHLENKILPSVIPTVTVTKKALLILEPSTVISNDKHTILLHVDLGEAKEYLKELHEEVGIPESIMETKMNPIIPIFIPHTTQ